MERALRAGRRSARGGRPDPPRGPRARGAGGSARAADFPVEPAAAPGDDGEAIARLAARLDALGKSFGAPFSREESGGPSPEADSPETVEEIRAELSRLQQPLAWSDDPRIARRTALSERLLERLPPGDSRALERFGAKLGAGGERDRAA